MGKEAIRGRIWDAVADRKVARFPFPPHGRIPNFAGAAEAAALLARSRKWTDATSIKVNPDAPQRPVRRRALEDGKTVYMAVPRLRETACFLRLDPDRIDDIDHATTIGGSAELGDPIEPTSIDRVDLIVAGSVAVDTFGGRIGKGEGYSDLEFAILREYGLVDNETTTATTVHEVQVVDERIPTTSVDVPMDRIATPDRSIETSGSGRKPEGIDWTRLTPSTLEAIPILEQLNRKTKD